MRELAGIIYLSASILLACSLFSYDPRDLPLTQSPLTSNNWIGIVGANLGLALYSTIGWSANLLPLVTLFLGVSCLFRSHFRLRDSTLWMLAFILSVSCLAQIFSSGRVGWKNTPYGVGGIWGLYIGEKLFWRFLKHGAFIIFGTFSVASLLIAFQVKPRQIYLWIYEQWQKRKTEKREEALRSGDIRTVLRTREEEITERQKLIERELVRRGKGLKQPSRPAPAEMPPSSPTLGANIPPEPAKSEETSSSPPKTEKPEYKIIRPGKPKRATQLALKSNLSGPYKLPPIDLLKRTAESIPTMDSKEEIARRGALIETTLKDFGIEVQMGEITQGSTITRFELIPSPGVKVERIVSLQNNISLALRADQVNILAPVAGKGTVGIEVANRSKAPVLIRELIESREFQESKAKIPLALGKDVYGKTLIADLTEMPHLLIAGSTGSGKSVCINSILTSILYHFSPEDMRLILIDPKVVELQMFNALPHLVVPVVSEPKKIIVALRWVVREMERRYKIMAKVGVRSIAAFNTRTRQEKAVAPSHHDSIASLQKAVENEEAQPMLIPDEEIVVPERMPFIVIFIDELADLMLTAPVDAEDAVTRITQMARAAGIHLVVATQTPRADIVTGTIKTNLPSKISFRVASKVDSRVILDENGAENLLGKGDMIYKSYDSSVLRRAQGAFISDDEVRDVVDCCTKQISASYDVEIHEKLSKPPSDTPETSDDDEDLVQQCIHVIRQEGRASTSLLQRRLRLGYTRAARVMDILEERGVVGPVQGSKDREILMRLDDSPSQN